MAVFLFKIKNALAVVFVSQELSFEQILWYTGQNFGGFLGTAYTELIFNLSIITERDINKTDRWKTKKMKFEKQEFLP